MGGTNKRIPGSRGRRGTDVLWEAARIQWALWPALFCVWALATLIWASFPSGEPPSTTGGGSLSSDTTAPVVPLPHGAAGVVFLELME
jgi:hypothetical protein